MSRPAAVTAPNLQRPMEQARSTGTIPRSRSQGGCMKKSMIPNLAATMLVTLAALGTAQPQDAPQELRLSDIKAQQPSETIYASALCQRARETPRGSIVQPYAIDSTTLVPDLNALLEESDEVVLAASPNFATVLSPSSESVAIYSEVRVIHSWKGTHRAGDKLTFGVPFGELPCDQPPHNNQSSFFVQPDDFALKSGGPYAWVLFLRQSKGKETLSVQGLRPAAGEGLQGMFLIQLPVPKPSYTENRCSGFPNEPVEHCASYLETSQSPVMVPYAHDPLAKIYGGMPASDFLRAVQSAAAAKGLDEKSSLK